ncbi:MAG: hypothetical protein U9Q68_03825 [Euryarchaeota archaeon]|nr:hypothetical protein [Euryarchaeota archaeon]
MLVKDPINKWGKEDTIGPAEQSVRGQAPPSVFDKRGELLYWDDFESQSKKYQDWVTAASAGSVERSTENSKFGDFCTKLVTGTTIADSAAVYYYLSDFNIDRIGAEISFASASVNSYIYIDLNYYDGTTQLRGKIAYDLATDILQVWSGGAWVSAATLPMFMGSSGDRLPFTTIKLVMDLANNNYVRALCAGSEVDLSAYTPITVADATKRGVVAYVWFQTKAASAQTAYIDDFKFTGNEPL